MKKKFVSIAFLLQVANGNGTSFGSWERIPKDYNYLEEDENEEPAK